MRVIYFILVFCYICVYEAAETNFCRLCTDHILCKYNVSGPSPACKQYDNRSLLTRKDIMEIVTQINKRRNFVAMGHTKILPTAANMKKIEWSNELAEAAQRWADQCDPFIRPDRHDQCRDLENTKVGQNIASVTGTSPGLNAKSFVELWWMQLLNYKGSVSFYNWSQDYKTNDFTQLIWADTELVGCGRAKFYINERNVSLERLVCNFAPEGNIDRKPVYAIGFPGTQCGHKMIRDLIYQGLCVYERRGKSQNSAADHLPDNILLKVLTLSNEGKEAIDPIPNHFKQETFQFGSKNISDEQKAKKTRHVFPNNTYVRAAKRILTPSQKRNFWKGFMNNSQNDYDYHYHNRGHSRLYHGYDPQTTYSYSNHDEGLVQNFRRYEYPTEPSHKSQYTSRNYRRYNPNHKCTRKSPDVCCTNNQCTRGCNNYQETSICQHTSSTCQTTHCCQLKGCCENSKFYPVIEDPVVNHDLCQCSKLPCPTVAPCKSKIDCQHNLRHTTSCPFHRRLGDGNRGTSNSEMHYYDLESNIAIRSGDKSPEEKGNKKQIDRPHQVNTNSHIMSNIDDQDYLYPSYDSSLKRKRQVEEGPTFKPLWQIDELNNQKPKMIRYTTLPTLKGRKLGKYLDHLKLQANTERITITTADENIDRVSEKYLSFDELMHLRKANDKYLDYDLRRQANKNILKQGKATTKAGGKTTKKAAATKATTKAAGKGTTKAAGKATTKKPNKATTKATTKATAKAATKATTKATAKTTKATTKAAATTTKATSPYTVQSTFERKKYCTRKLTCTWTAITGYGVNGSGIDGGAGGPSGGYFIDIGSRTPPGYVEGCTRTSTCTRDFMDRNKISTKPDTDSSKDEVVEDEDYCERKSLNIRRRNSDDNDIVEMKDPQKIIVKDLNSESVVHDSDMSSVIYPKENGCFCNEKNRRKKRQYRHHLQLHETRIKHYDDIGKTTEDNPSMLNKLDNAHRNKIAPYAKNCPCNSGHKYFLQITELTISIIITKLARNILM